MNSREKFGDCMKNDDAETSSQFQAAETSKLNPTNLIGELNQFSTVCAARENHYDQIPAGHPDTEKVYVR
jgi:hypothetical protein